MADTSTTNFDLTLPDIGGSDGSWGGKLNGNFSLIDTLLGRTIRVSDSIGALPAAASRAGRVFAFDGAGDPTTIVVADTADSSLRTDLASSTGGALVSYIASGTGAVSRTAASRLVDVLHVKDYGAIGNGATDDTAAIQAAVNAAIAQNKPLDFGGLSYVSGSITLADFTNLTINGSGAHILIMGDMSGAVDNTTRDALFMFSGVCAGFRLSGFHFEGSDTLAEKQRVFGYDFANPPTLSDFYLEDFTIEKVLIGGAFPGIQNLKVTKFKIKDSLGEDPGQGLGFATELAGVTRSKGVVFSDFYLENMTRHGIYINHADDVVISNGVASLHRSELFSASTTSTGRAAIIVSRSSRVSVSDCIFDQCRDVALAIDQDSTYTVEDITVDNCIFYKTQGSSIRIGRTLASGEARNIVVSGIVLNLLQGWADPDIDITDVQDLTIENVRVKGDVSYAASKKIFRFSEYDAGYWKRVLVKNVRGVISTSGSGYLIEISDALSTSSGGNVELIDNALEGATRLYLYNAGAVAGACNNANIRSDWTFVQDITSSGTPSIAGYNRFVINLSGAGNITDFNNGYDGQTIDLFFANGNATIKNTNLIVAGAADFVGSSNDTMSLRKMAASSNRWVEIGRSVN